MKYKKIHFAFDRKNNSIAKKLKLLKRYKKYSPRNSDLIVVLGGDGFMLETLKKFRKFNKPFYGMNTGTYGFLMNRLKYFKVKICHHFCFANGCQNKR